jgi:hypothetical protein
MSKIPKDDPARFDEIEVGDKVRTSYYGRLYGNRRKVEATFDAVEKRGDAWFLGQAYIVPEGMTESVLGDVFCTRSSFVRLTKKPKPVVRVGATHCQVCARQVESKTGLIAHHGYKRPGDGWQTSSCHGARQLPWEQDCTALRKWILLVAERLARCEAGVAALVARPATLRNPAYGEWMMNEKYLREKWTRARPAYPEPAKEFVRDATAVGDRYEYDRLLRSLIDEAEYQVKLMQQEAARCDARLASWKSPNATVECHRRDR